MISAHWSHLIHRPSTRARLSCAGSLGAGTLWYQAMRALVAQVGPPFRTRSCPQAFTRSAGGLASVQLLVLQPEEGLQRFEDAGLLLADPGLPLVGVEALAHRGQL